MARIAAVFEMQANSASVRQVYAAGDHLFHQGDTDRGIHKIVSGTVTVYRVTADGHRQIEAFAGPGDYVSHDGSRPMSVVWRLRTPMPTRLARVAVG